MTLNWATVSGPGVVTFADPVAAATTASFSRAGFYVLRVTATDGALTASDDVEVTVQPGPIEVSPGLRVDFVLDTPRLTASATGNVRIDAWLINDPSSTVDLRGEQLTGSGFSWGTLIFHATYAQSNPYVWLNEDLGQGIRAQLDGAVIRPGESLRFTFGTLTPLAGPVAAGIYMATLDLGFGFCCQFSQPVEVSVATVESYVVNVGPVPTTGRVATEDGRIDCGLGGTGACTAAYDHGTSVVLTAVPAPGYQTGPWGGCDTASGGLCTVLVTQPRTVSVTFTGIQSAPLAVTSVAPMPSGFAVHLNRPLDPAALNLYATQSGGEGPADVTLTGDAQGAIRGTLIIDADTGSMVFVKTGGPLPADRYTVRLRSATDGFKDRDGQLLDGNGTAGDDYEASFTVEAPPSLVVRVPDMARGPGQSVDVPATMAGIPIELSDGTNVESVDFRLSYDLALLEITDVALGAGLPTNALLAFNIEAPGRLVVGVSFPTPPPGGRVQLVRIGAHVPASAPYRAKHLLHLDQVAVNEGTVPVLADDGVHVVAYFGDATGNFGYSSLDGQRVLRVAVRLDEGFASYPLVDPAIIGDITANGTLSSLDATRIVQEVVGLDRAEIPPLPGVLSPVFVTGPDPLVRLRRGLRVRPGGTLTVPVTIDDADGLEALDLTVAVDPKVFEVVDVRAGSVMRDGTVVSKVDDAGTVTVAVAALTPRGPGGGSLVELDLRARPGAAGSSRIDLQDVSLNERGLTLSVTPRPGADETDASVMISD